MFRAIILPIYRSTIPCVTASGIIHPLCCYLYQWCTVKQISDNEIYLLTKYIKSVLWRVAKRLSYIEDARCLKVNTRSASAASLPESANSGQIDLRVVYCLLIYVMLSEEGKYLKIIIYLNLVIYFVMFYTYDVSNRPIPGNIAYNEWNL